MGSIISLIVVLSLSILITRVAAILLSYTGLSKDAASFQARSAFTGVGFTTSESENIVNHPVRRKIIRSLMLIGNAGVISAMASLILAFVGSESDTTSWYIKIGILLLTVVLLWALASSKFLEKKLEKLVYVFTEKYTSLSVRDYANLLQLTENYEISELAIEDDDWLAGKNLAKADLRSEGINVLGIKKANGDYIGAPDGDSEIEAGDNLLLYGKEDALQNLDFRKDTGGEQKHEEAKEKHRKEKEEQEKEKQKREAENKAEEKDDEAGPKEEEAASTE